MNRTLPLLALALTLTVASPATAELPTTEELERYFTILEQSNRGTARLETMAVTVSSVPDYFLYLLAGELIKADMSSKKKVIKKVTELCSEAFDYRAKRNNLVKESKELVENLLI